MSDGDARAATARPLRVLHAIGSMSPARGGPSVTTLNSLRGLATAGIECDLVTTDDDGPHARLTRVRAGEPDRRFGWPMRFFPRQSRIYSASGPLLGWLARHVGDYDLLHVRGAFSCAADFSALAAAVRGVPYVVQPHGVLEQWGMQNRRPRLKQVAMAAFIGPLLRRAGAVIFTSSWEAQQANLLGLRIRDVVIPHAIPAPRAIPVDDSRAVPDPRFQALRGRPWALYLGRFDRKKGLERLFDAFAQARARVPDAMLVVAGDGDASYVNELHQRAEAVGVHEHLLWPGFVTAATKQWLLEHCTVFVLASSSENFCIAAAEAMAHGRPVVLTEAVGIAEYVPRWNAGYVTGPDPAEFADRVAAVLSDRALAAAMGERARAGVASELSLAAHGRTLADLYRRVAQRHSTAAHASLS